MERSNLVNQERLKDKLIQCDLFACLSDQQLFSILGEAEILFMKKGDYLHREGEIGDFVSYIFEGEFTVFMHDKDNNVKELATIQKNAIVGESSIFFKGKRVASVVALNDAVVFNISETLIRKLLHANQQFKAELKKTSLERMKDNFGTIYFKLFFPEANDTLIKAVTEKMELIDINKGDILYEEGDLSDSLYFLVRGRLKTHLFDPSVQESRDIYFTPGETIGDVTAFSNENRDATVRALRNSYVLKLSINALNEIKKEHPSLTDILLKISMQKVKNVQQGDQHFLNPKTFAIVPLHKSLDPEEFLRKLSESITNINHTAKIADIEFVNQRLNVENFQKISHADPQYFHLNSMFSTIEKDHNFCFYVVDKSLDAWSKYCLDNADEIILLADSTKRPDLTPFEKKHFSTNQNNETPKRLILIHPDETVQPTNTLEWLNQRQVLIHHHIKESLEENDINRLLRFISNQAIGIVLSGGGNRGNAHLGVCDALIEQEIPFDFIGGTSYGSFVAAMYTARQFKREDIDPAFRAFQKTFKFDYTLPVVSLFSGKSLEKSLETAFGDIQIEDMWTPFFCVSCNLSKSEPHFHRTGRLATAVRASISLPGIFPPVIMNGDVLVDGGLIFNLPIHPMKEFIRGGRIIASFVIEEEEEESNKFSGLSLSGWRYLWNQFSPFSSKSNISIPNIGSILYRAGTVSSTYEQNIHEKRNHADLMIKPPVGHFKSMDYEQLDEIRIIGYQETIDCLKNLKKISRETWNRLKGKYTETT